MTREMTFNGVDMSRFFRITDIIRPIGNTRSVSTDNAPLLGVNIQQVKRGAKEHTIKFDMKTTSAMEIEQLKHDLAGVLDVEEPVRIVYAMSQTNTIWVCRLMRLPQTTLLDGFNGQS